MQKNNSTAGKNPVIPTVNPHLTFSGTDFINSVTPPQANTQSATVLTAETQTVVNAPAPNNNASETVASPIANVAPSVMDYAKKYAGVIALAVVIGLGFWAYKSGLLSIK